jgi:hypothetical protein
MRYPATVTWCDTKPESWQDYTGSHTVSCEEELEVAMDLFEKDARNLRFPLIGRLHDCEGHELTFGFYDDRDRAFMSFQPRHLLANEKGHYQYSPLRWSVANQAKASNLPPILHTIGRERIDFFLWTDFDPYQVMPQYCVPMTLVRLVIREYLDTG